MAASSTHVAASPTTDLFRRQKLDAGRAELCCTERAVVAKLHTRSSVKTIFVGLHNPSRSRQVRRLAVYRATAPVPVSRLRVDRSTWQRVASVELAPGATEAAVELPSPLTFSACVVEFIGFHANLHAKSQEMLQCPRCSRPVTDRHGVCDHCRENAHQCRHCRNINYEHLDAFICNECGHSRHARVEISIAAKPAGSYPRVLTEEDAARAVSDLETESASAARARATVNSLRNQLRKMLESAPGEDGDESAAAESVSRSPPRRRGDDAGATAGVFKVGRRASDVAAMYGERCAAAHAQAAAAERRRRGVQSALAERAMHSSSDGTKSARIPEESGDGDENLALAENRRQLRLRGGFRRARPAPVRVHRESRSRSRRPRRRG